MAEPFLEIKGLTKQFGGLMAVNSVGFSMERDKILGLIGPNGAGKTTLLRLITGILKPDAGTVRFMGKEIVGRKIWDIVNMGIACT
jgi:branched-chain amino acid transport system ATP-binding protein